MEQAAADRLPVGAGNSDVVVDLSLCGPMLSPRVPHHAPIPGPRMERETPGQRPRPNYGHPHAPADEFSAIDGEEGGRADLVCDAAHRTTAPAPRYPARRTLKPSLLLVSRPVARGRAIAG